LGTTTTARATDATNSARLASTADTTCATDTSRFSRSIVASGMRGIQPPSAENVSSPAWRSKLGRQDTTFCGIVNLASERRH
jgi:hypothetical protein